MALPRLAWPWARFFCVSGRDRTAVWQWGLGVQSILELIDEGFARLLLFEGFDICRGEPLTATNCLRGCRQLELDIEILLAQHDLCSVEQIAVAWAWYLHPC